MRRVVPRAGIGLLCAAALAIPALRAGPPRAADPGIGAVTTDTTRSASSPPRDGTITTDPLSAETPAPQTPPAETLLAEPPPADTPPPVNPPRDTTPPDTAIASAVVDGSRATFSFTSTEAHSIFQCRLDRAAFARCSSPAVYLGLAVGSHTFAVRATDGAANVDPSPATTSVVIAGPPAQPGPAPAPGRRPLPHRDRSAPPYWRPPAAPGSASTPRLRSTTSRQPRRP